MKTAPRPYHHGHLRTALMQAAERALVSRGRSALSLRELSRAIGVSHTSPRRHFASKQALLDALAQDGFARFNDALAAAVGSGARGSEPTLIRIAQAYVGFTLQNPALWSLMFEMKHRPGGPPELRDASTAAFAHLLEVLRRGQAVGEIVTGDPAKLSLTLSAALQGLVALSTDGQFKGQPVSALVPALVRQILHGLRPRHGAVGSTLAPRRSRRSRV